MDGKAREGRADDGGWDGRIDLLAINHQPVKEEDFTQPLVVGEHNKKMKG